MVRFSLLLFILAFVSAGMLGAPQEKHQAEEWPRAEAGIWRVAGTQIPAGDTGSWNHEENACRHPEAMFRPSLNGEFVPEIPIQQHCQYRSMRLNGLPQFEITATCSCGDLADCKPGKTIRIVVTLKSSREFNLLWERRDENEHGETSVVYVTKHGRWLRACTQKEKDQDQ